MCSRLLIRVGLSLVAGRRVRFVCMRSISEPSCSMLWLRRENYFSSRTRRRRRGCGDSSPNTPNRNLCTIAALMPAGRLGTPARAMDVGDEGRGEGVDGWSAQLTGRAGVTRAQWTGGPECRSNEPLVARSRSQFNFVLSVFYTSTAAAAEVNFCGDT